MIGQWDERYILRGLGTFAPIEPPLSCREAWLGGENVLDIVAADIH